LPRERARRLLDGGAPLRTRRARGGVFRLHAARRVVRRELARVVGVDLLAVLLAIARDRLVGVSLEIRREARLALAAAGRKIFRLDDAELARIDVGVLDRLLEAACGEEKNANGERGGRARQGVKSGAMHFRANL